MKMPRQKSKTGGAVYKPTAIDLFCGCGGLTAGLKIAGFQVIGAIENDKIAVQTYKSNHRGVQVWESDIRKIRGAEIMRKLGLEKNGLDLLAGCPPCQGFSRMRSYNGGKEIHDDRNDLLYDFMRLVEELRPKAIMMENVPGLADQEHLFVFLRKMKKMGYRGAHKILNTVNYGVPQRRRRLIYLAGVNRKIPFGRECWERITVRHAISGMEGAGKSGDRLHDMPEKRTDSVKEIIRNIPLDGGSRGSLPENLVLKCHKKKSVGFMDVYGRMAWDEPSPTITGGCNNPSKGRFLHPDEDRAITLREAALLQGFHPEYNFESDNKGVIALMIGNALPPAFIAAHAKSVINTLKY